MATVTKSSLNVVGGAAAVVTGTVGTVTFTVPSNTYAVISSISCSTSDCTLSIGSAPVFIFSGAIVNAQFGGGLFVPPGATATLTGPLTSSRTNSIVYTLFANS